MKDKIQKPILIVIKTPNFYSYVERIEKDLITRGIKVKIIALENTAAEDNLVHLQSHKIDIITCQSTILTKTHKFLHRLLNYNSFANRGAPETYYQRYKNQLPKIFSKIPFSFQLLKSSFIKIAIFYIIRLLPIPSEIKNYLTEFEDHMVLFLPHNKFPGDEMLWIKACRLIKRPTVAITLSWDNLLTKGIHVYQADYFFCWNESDRTALVKYHGYKKEKVVIIGSTFFDKWINIEKIYINDSSEEKQKYILYLGSSRNITGNESVVINNFARKIREYLPSYKLIVRLHPSNYVYSSELDSDLMIVKIGNVPTDNKQANNFFSLMKNAICVVGINTSAMVDSVVCDCPTVALQLDQYKATQFETPHFVNLHSTNALHICKSFIEFLQKIKI